MRLTWTSGTRPACDSLPRSPQKVRRTSESHRSFPTAGYGCTRRMTRYQPFSIVASQAGPVPALLIHTSG